MQRYQVIAESQSNHCCFSATVIDTAKPNTSIGAAGEFEIVCECFSLEDANKVADALNASDAKH